MRLCVFDASGREGLHGCQVESIDHATIMLPPHPTPPHPHSPSPISHSRSTDLKEKKTVFIGWTGIGKTNFARPQQPADTFYRLDMHRQHELVDKALAASTPGRDKAARRQDPLMIADKPLIPPTFEAVRI